MEKIWFKPKIFGWGWFPINSEGWFMTFLYLLVVYYTVTKEMWLNLIIGSLIFAYFADKHTTKPVLFKR